MLLKVLKLIITYQIFGWGVIVWQTLWAATLFAYSFMIESGGMIGIEIDPNKMLKKAILVFLYAVTNLIILRI